MNAANGKRAHLVQDLQFEVEFASEAQALDGQGQVQAFAQRAALRIIEETFDEALGGAGFSLRLDELELDLGELDPSHPLESQWEVRLREQLLLVLAPLARRAAGQAGTAGQGDVAGTAGQTDLNALTSFLRQGRLPWHMPADTNLARLAEQAWRHDEAALCAWLRELGADERVRVVQRMVRQLPADWCQRLAERLDDPRDTVEAARTAGASAASRARAPFTANTSGEMAAPAESAGQRGATMAGRAGVAPAIERELMNALTTRWPSVRAVAAPDVSDPPEAGSAQAASPASTASSPEGRPQAAAHSPALRNLLTFLRHGRLPRHMLADADLAALADGVLRHDEAALCAWLREVPAHERARVVQRMARQLPAGWCSRLAAALGDSLDHADAAVPVGAPSSRGAMGVGPALPASASEAGVGTPRVALAPDGEETFDAWPVGASHAGDFGLAESRVVAGGSSDTPVETGLAHAALAAVARVPAESADPAPEGLERGVGPHRASSDVRTIGRAGDAPAAAAASGDGAASTEAALHRSARAAISQALEQRLLEALRAPRLPMVSAVVAGGELAAEAGPTPALPGALTPEAGTGSPQAAVPSVMLRRRLKAVLLDTAPTLSDQDLDELLPLWQRLREQDLSGLRASLAEHGRLARVRRRIARLWPQILLHQLPRLWLGEEEARRVIATLQGTPTEARHREERRRRWEAWLRQLWVGAQPGPGLAGADGESPGPWLHAATPAAAQDYARGLARAPTRPALAPGRSATRALQAGTSSATHSWPRQPAGAAPADPWRVAALAAGESRPAPTPPRPSQPSEPLPPPGAVPGEQAATRRAPLCAGGDRRGRALLQSLRRNRPQLHRLAHRATASDLAAVLAIVLPMPQAEALAAMVFAPLPAAWRAAEAGLPLPDAQRLCRWAMEWAAERAAEQVSEESAARIGDRTDASSIERTGERTGEQASKQAAQALVQWLCAAIATHQRRPPPQLMAALAPPVDGGPEDPQRLPWAAQLAEVTAPAVQSAQPTVERAATPAARAPAVAGRLHAVLAALDRGDAAALNSAWAAAWSDAGLDIAARRHLLQQLTGHSHWRDRLVPWLAGAHWRALPARLLPPPAARVVMDAFDALQVPAGNEARASLPPHEMQAWSAALREQSLWALAWLPGAAASSLAEQLLEQAAAQAGLSMPALARRLALGDGHPLAVWAAEVEPMDIAASGAAPGGPQAPPAARTAGGTEAGLADREPQDEMAMRSQLMAALREAGCFSGAAGQLPTPWQELGHGDESAVVRAAVARELESAVVARHVAARLSSDALRQVIAWLRPADAPALQAIWLDLLALAGSAGPAQTRGQAAWPRVAALLLREFFEEDRPLVPGPLLARVAADVSAPGTAVLEGEPSRSGAASPSVPDSPSEPDSLRGGDGRPPGRGAAGEAAAGPPRVAAISPGAPQPAARPGGRGPADAPAQPSWLLESLDEPWFVGNAGLVLLAPYLPRLFALRGLTRERSFVDADAAERALALMQFAATGDAAAAEPRLALNKLLCGLPLEAPVWREVELTGEECEAVHGMLSAVIDHWKALGRTSLAGLRQTFLCREGRLEHRDSAWFLEVPNQTFDMLIDRLPWGFGTIRYPWMNEVLHVQWR